MSDNEQSIEVTSRKRARHDESYQRNKIKEGRKDGEQISENQNPLSYLWAFIFDFRWGLWADKAQVEENRKNLYINGICGSDTSSTLSINSDFTLYTQWKKIFNMMLDWDNEEDAAIMAVNATAAQFSGYNHDDEYADLENEEINPSLLGLLSPTLRQSGLENLDTADFDPYAEETKNVGASFSVTKHKPFFGVSTGTGVSLLKPQIEVLHLIEAFLKLKTELVTRLSALINENYDLIKAVINLIFSKVGYLQAFSLTGISVIRKIIDFALNLFGNVGISSSVSVGVPHEVYGAPNYR
ncbi:hypothetical protein ILUMI_11217 [Ignelater luminosus]|uniref:Uncharacterized protein n=1 Tax=Ignelater luminosus TaxID=2038154 RepID=A0A8K0D0M5_IGNLU|nr:hypothetical protein ILUMI_11217 [Ignelater luminosus]